MSRGCSARATRHDFADAFMPRLALILSGAGSLGSYDYRLGRRASRASLATLLSLDAPPPLEPGFEKEYEIPPSWERFKDATLAEADMAPRIALRDMLLARARYFIETQTIGPRWLRWLTRPAAKAAVAGAVRAKLDKVLGLDRKL